MTVGRGVGLAGPLLGDLDHLGRQVDPGDDRPERPGQVERRAADPAADVEDPGARPEGPAQLGAEVLGGLVAAGADVPVAEDLLVPEDAGPGVLPLVVVGGGLRVRRCSPWSWVAVGLRDWSLEGRSPRGRGTAGGPRRDLARHPATITGAGPVASKPIGGRKILGGPARPNRFDHRALCRGLRSGYIRTSP